MKRRSLNHITLQERDNFIYFGTLLATLRFVVWNISFVRKPDPLH